MGYSDVQTVIKSFQTTVDRYPDSLAIICRQQSKSSYNVGRWTYLDLHQTVQQFAHGLAAHNAWVGTPMFIFCRNQVEYAISTLAAYYLGLISIPIEPGMLKYFEDVRHMVDTVLRHYNPDRVVVLANDKTSAEKLDQLILPAATIKICVEGGSGDWIPFQELLLKTDRKYQQQGQTGEQSIFFTSGSTVLPKCCLIKPVRWFYNLEPSLSLGSFSPQDCIVIPVPASHAFGYICTILSLLRGACVVFPGTAYSTQAVVDAVWQESCTHAAIVPTMAHSLIEELSGSPYRIESLKGLTLAGGAITPELLMKCKTHLGVSSMENFYGMTEGVFATTCAVEDLGQVIEGPNVSVGKPIQGEVRICAPGDYSTVPPGIEGELHFCSKSMITQYIGKRTDDFYEVDGETWFITGDRGLVDHEGRLFILGRHKDMISRGGKSISLPKIEAVLAQVPELYALEPQIVAAADPIAGEVPLAVIKGKTDHSVVKQLQDTIRSSLGVSHVPGHIVSLEILGRTDYPRTSVGKVQRTKLAEMVQAYQELQEIADSTNYSVDISRAIQTVWARVSGISIEELDLKRPISDFADSITMLIARDQLRKGTGRQAPLRQWNATTTISDQIALLNHSPLSTGEQNTSSPSQQEQPTGPPEDEDIAHLGGDKTRFNATKTAIEKIISQHGLSWNEVAAVCPCTDFIQLLCRTRVINDWNIRTAIVTKDATMEHLRTALEAVVRNNPVVTSFMVIDPAELHPELGLYVMIRPTKEYLHRCILLDYGTVDTLDDLRALMRNYPAQDHTRLPGPLFRALLMFVRETNSAAVITNCSHSALDAIYHQMLNADLDQALGGHALRPHVPFRSWADTFYALRKSPIAETAVRFHTEYLCDLRKHQHVLWPRPTHDLVVSPERQDISGHIITFPAPSFVRLRKRCPSLTTPIILKAALALLIISRTNHSHALFANMEAARSTFPFLPASIAAQGTYDAVDVAGPTFGIVLNLITFHPEETVLEYLMRVQQTQVQLSKHASVSWHEVLRRLDISGDVVPSVAESMLFNWMPGLAPAALGNNPFKNMQILKTHIRTKLGMLASAAAGGPDGSQIIIYLEGALANTSTAWVARAAEEWKRIALWLSDESTLSMPVARFHRALGIE